ncbi:MAG TPA: DUF924 family protein [Kofleriaceae bacterium]|nr:DUF924 family protein [Kofleriaceae bacterium]
MSDFERVLDFWLGELDRDGRADRAHAERWWRADPAFDEEVRERFLADHEAVMAGRREGWLEDPRGRVAYVIVLDQLSRNMFRGTPGMFAGDARALAAAREAVDAGLDRDLPHDMRYFLYMPFMHSESLADQDRCVELFRALTGEAEPSPGSALDFAIRHRDIVARFGRFPHRNAILGRASTREEQEFLEQPGSSF